MKLNPSLRTARNWLLFWCVAASLLSVWGLHLMLGGNAQDGSAVLGMGLLCLGMLVPFLGLVQCHLATEAALVRVHASHRS